MYKIVLGQLNNMNTSISKVEVQWWIVCFLVYEFIWCFVDVNFVSDTHLVSADRFKSGMTHH